jgi:hypothetical protein
MVIIGTIDKKKVSDKKLMFDLWAAVLLQHENSNIDVHTNIVKSPIKPAREKIKISSSAISSVEVQCVFQLIDITNHQKDNTSYHQLQIS